MSNRSEETIKNRTPPKPRGMASVVVMSDTLNSLSNSIENENLSENSMDDEENRTAGDKNLMAPNRVSTIDKMQNDIEELSYSSNAMSHGAKSH